MKTRIVALLLAWFCGVMGFHDFYLNRNVAGHIKEIIFVASFVFLFWPVEFFRILGIIGFAGVILWTLIDFFKLTDLTDEEFNKLYNK